MIWSSTRQNHQCAIVLACREKVCYAMPRRLGSEENPMVHVVKEFGLEDKK